MKEFRQARRPGKNGKDGRHNEELEKSIIPFLLELTEVPMGNEVPVFIGIPVVVHRFLDVLFDTVTGPVFMAQFTLDFSIIHSFFLCHFQSQNPMRRRQVVCESSLSALQ